MTLKKKNWINRNWVNRNWIKSMMFAFVMIGLLTFTSCQKEALEPNNTEDVLNSDILASGGLAGLTQGGRDEDGQEDGISGEDFEIQYPVEVVFPDGTTTTVNSDDELFTLIEDWFEENDPGDDDEVPTLVFPVSVTLENGTVVTIDSEGELDDLIEEYFEYDEDYEDYEDYEEGDLGDLQECFTIEYPITIVLPDGSSNPVNDLEEAETVLDAFYETNEDEDEHPAFAYPINVTFEDGTTEVLNDEDEFEELVEECFGFYDDCNDDDDDG